MTLLIYSIGHLRSNFVGLLVYDNSVHIRGTGVVLQVHQEIANLAEKWLISWVDHMMLSYGMIILLQHILYIYYNLETLPNDKL